MDKTMVCDETDKDSIRVLGKGRKELLQGKAGMVFDICRNCSAAVHL